ncbi:hypothetical protein LINGRAHAP2_LOCUS28810 [Linum grandiflorum]
MRLKLICNARWFIRQRYKKSKILYFANPRLTRAYSI